MIKKLATISRKKQPKSRLAPRNTTDTAKPFIEHINELRVRLMWVVLSLSVASIVGYVIHEQLLAVIRKPLGQTLYYTSPVGGLNFLMKLCLTFGVVVTLPVIMYQLLKFFHPILEKAHKTATARYVIWSIMLAYSGVAFAYFVSLPAALHFLANFGGKDITSLITADEYYSFALSYLLGFALLFQLPIIVLFTNRIKPLKPGGMMKFQRWIILISFIVAAILTPTPDPINQAIMAAPAIILYQVSLIMVWAINRHNKVVYKSTKAIPNVIVDKIAQQPMPVRAARAAPSMFLGKETPRKVISDFQRVMPVKREERNLLANIHPSVVQPPRQMRVMDIF